MEAKDAAGVSEPGQRPARRRRPLLLLLQVTTLALVAGLLALLVWRIVERENGSRFVSDIAAGKRPQAPGFTLPVIWTKTSYWPPRLRRALADGEVSLDELRGYPVVINFWASWCVSCRDEATALAAVARAHAGRVVFLGVDSQDLSSDARHFLRRYRVAYVSVRDGSGTVYEHYGLTGLPETYYIDARGHAVAHSPGAVDPDSARIGVRAALRG